MALHDDEMNKRREKREALRKKQQAQAKRMRRTLFLAALVLVLCGAGIWYLTKDSRAAEAQAVMATEAPTEAPKETKAASPLQQDPITKIHIRAA